MKLSKTYIEKAKDREIINYILAYIGSDTSVENKYSEMVEESSNGEITKNEFHDWMGTFDLREYID